MFFSSSNNDNSDLRRQLREIRQEQASQRVMLEAIAQQLGIATEADPAQTLADVHGMPVAVVAALDAGKKIEAIKAYREATLVGLKEAKDAVEDYERDRGY